MLWFHRQETERIRAFSCLLFFKSKRNHIVEQAVIALIKSYLFTQLEGFDQELILREVPVASIKTQIVTPKRKMYQKHVEIKSSQGDQPQNKKKEKDEKISLQVQIAETNWSYFDPEHTESSV